MISTLTGRVESVEASSAVIEVHGVGYEVRMAAADLAALHAGQETHVFTSLTISQDAVTLFGFLSPASKRMFLQLQKVSGIGPKVALSLLSTLLRTVWPRPSRTATRRHCPRLRAWAKKAHRRSSLNWQAASTSTRYGPKPMGRRKVATPEPGR